MRSSSTIAGRASPHCIREREPALAEARRSGMRRSSGFIACLATLAALASGCNHSSSPDASPTGPIVSSGTESATIEQPDIALRITLGDIAWKLLSRDGGSSSWRKSGAIVELTCDPTTISMTYDGDPPREGGPDPGEVCNAIVSQPSLLTATDAGPCEIEYWHSTVAIDGTANGQPVHLNLETCSQFYEGPVDPAQNWLAVLGMQVPGPDPPG